MNDFGTFVRAFRELWLPWPKAIAVFAWMAGVGGCGFAFLFGILTPVDFSIRLAAGFGIPTALVYMGLMPLVTGRSPESLISRQDDGELWSRLVQDQQGAVGRGGRLILREQTLAFDASAAERKMGAASWELPIREIQFVEILARSPNLFAGGFQRRMRLSTRDGAIKVLLTVSQLRQTADAIRAAIGREAEPEPSP